jgi:hypothetical protein
LLDLPFLLEIYSAAQSAENVSSTLDI